MALERRGKNRLYFYVSRRAPDGRVRKLYLGGGIVGQLAADQFAEIQAQKRAIANENQALVRLFSEVESLLKNVHRRVDLLAAATLYAAGYYQHRSAWRPRRRCPRNQSSRSKSC